MISEEQYSNFMTVNTQHEKEVREEIGLKSDDSGNSQFEMHGGHDLLDSFSEDSDPYDMINTNEVNIFGGQLNKSGSSYDPFQTETMTVENNLKEKFVSIEPLAEIR